MRTLARIRAFTHFLFWRSKFEGEMEEEFRLHQRRRAQDLERQGLSREEAERKARVEFGGYQSYKEECREALGTRLPGEFIADMRFGLRQLRRNPGFTIVAVLTLALGVGANTAVFSLVDEVWLRPRPVPHPERMVRIFTSNPSSGGEISRAGSSYLDYYYISRGAQSFSGVASFQMRGGLLDTHGESKLVDVAVVSDNFFDVLAPSAAAGACSDGRRSVCARYAHRDAQPPVLGRPISRGRQFARQNRLP